LDRLEPAVSRRRSIPARSLLYLVVARPQVQAQAPTLAGALAGRRADSQTPAPFSVALLERGAQLLLFLITKELAAMSEIDSMTMSAPTPE